MRRSLPLLAGTLLAAGGILALVLGSSRSDRIYSVSVSQLLARGLWDRPVRVEGTLIYGTLCRVDAECGYRFRMADNSAWNPDGEVAPRSPEQLSVAYDGCLLPDTLRDRLHGLDTRVVVEGERCRSCHDFKASIVMARSGGKYELMPSSRENEAASLPIRRCGSLSSP